MYSKILGLSVLIENIWSMYMLPVKTVLQLSLSHIDWMILMLFQIGEKETYNWLNRIILLFFSTITMALRIWERKDVNGEYHLNSLRQISVIIALYAITWLHLSLGGAKMVNGRYCGYKISSETRIYFPFYNRFAWHSQNSFYKKTFREWFLLQEIHEGLDFSSGDDGGYSFGIFSIKFSTDGHELVAGSSDDSIYVYDLEANKPSLRILAHTV